jgi:uncharacterized protein (TIGR03086 family)
MTQTPDLTAAAERMTILLRGVSDDQLDGPTPCPAYTVGDLVDHIGGLALGFTWAGTKNFPPEAGRAPSGDAARLPDDWREAFAKRLTTMAHAWLDPAAWDGMTQAGGVDLPGQVAGCVAMDELVVHGWDLAVATGQPYDVDAASIEVSLGFVGPVSEPEAAQQRQGVFGPVVPVSGDASALDRLIGLAGRDPSWSPSP